MVVRIAILIRSLLTIILHPVTSLTLLTVILTTITIVHLAKDISILEFTMTAIQTLITTTIAHRVKDISTTEIIAIMTITIMTTEA